MRRLWGLAGVIADYTVGVGIVMAHFIIMGSLHQARHASAGDGYPSLAP